MFKLFLIKFIKFLYTNYIYEDFSDYNKIGKYFIYPFWFVRIFYIAILSPIFLIEYFWFNSKLFKLIDDILNNRNISNGAYIINKKD